MAERYWSIKEAAAVLGLSEKTIRRRIKDGSIKAEQITGKYGVEYRIMDLNSVPAEVMEGNGWELDSGGEERRLSVGEEGALNKALDMIRDLQAEVEKLSAQVGFLQAQLMEAQNRIKLLSAPKQPWWQRLLWWK